MELLTGYLCYASLAIGATALLLGVAAAVIAAVDRDF